MLDKIMDYFKQGNDTRTLTQLARELQIKASALEGMLDFLVKKEKLKVDFQQTMPASGCAGKARGACVSCPFKGKSKQKGIKYYYMPS